jgi:hypothetical protein
MGGGPSSEQKAAAASQANLTNQLAGVANRQQDFFEKQQNTVNPFYLQRMQSGLPYFNALTDAQSGLTAQAFAPARADLMRRLSSSTLPSGFANQAQTDLASQQARAFDQNLLGSLGAQEQAKQAGAAGLMGQAQIANPQGYYQGAMGGNQSIMQAPLQRPGIGGILGGLAGGAMGAAGF